MPSPKTETSGRRMDASGLFSDQRFALTRNSFALFAARAQYIDSAMLLCSKNMDHLVNFWADFCGFAG